MSDSDSTDLVSVIIPIYNTGDLFIRCIESVMKQSYANLEIILVDDCSTDKATLELIDRYAAADGRITVLRNSKNRGLSHSRNKGVKACRGEFFTFLDSDDALSPDMVERMLAALKSSGTDFAVCDGVNVPLENDYKGDEDLDYFKVDLEDRGTYKCSDLIDSGRLRVLPICAYCKLFRLDSYLRAELDFKEGVFYEDNDWALRLMFGMSSFVYLKFDGYVRILHGASITNQISDKHIADRMLTYDLMSEVLERHNMEDAYKCMLIGHLLGSINDILKRNPSEEGRRMCVKYLETAADRLKLDLSGGSLRPRMTLHHVMYKLFKIMRDKERHAYHKCCHELIKSYGKLQRLSDIT